MCVRRRCIISRVIVYSCAQDKLISSRRCFLLFLFPVPGRSQIIALRRSHNDSRRKQHEARLSIHRVVHIHVMKKKRRSAHVEGEDDSEEYISSKGVMVSDVFYGKLDSLMMTCCIYWRATHRPWMHDVMSIWISCDVYIRVSDSQ